MPDLSIERKKPAGHISTTNENMATVLLRYVAMKLCESLSQGRKYLLGVYLDREE